MATNEKNVAVQAQAKPIAEFKNVSERTLAMIERLQSDGSLTLPNNYSVENHLKSAWLILQETKDRDNKLALAVCTKESIANALFDMVLQGLAVSKKQGYFIVHGNKLEFQRSYFGTVALAKRAGGIIGEPVANVIYEGDDFVYSIDAKTGRTQLIKHEQKIENIDNTKIKGAYAIVTYKDGTTQLTVMSIQQIRAAWNQGATKGNSPAHKNFPEEMAKKTVVNRACKMVINAADDAWIYEDKTDALDVDMAAKQREAAIASDKPVVDVDEVEYETVEELPEEQSQPQQEVKTEQPSTIFDADLPNY